MIRDIHNDPSWLKDWALVLVLTFWFCNLVVLVAVVVWDVYAVTHGKVTVSECIMRLATASPWVAYGIVEYIRFSVAFAIVCPACVLTGHLLFPQAMVRAILQSKP